MDGFLPSQRMGTKHRQSKGSDCDVWSCHIFLLTPRCLLIIFYCMYTSLFKSVIVCLWYCLPRNCRVLQPAVCLLLMSRQFHACWISVNSGYTHRYIYIVLLLSLFFLAWLLTKSIVWLTNCTFNTITNDAVVHTKTTPKVFTLEG